MITLAKNFGGLIVLVLLSGALSAQQKVEIPPQKTKDIGDKFTSPQTGVGKNIREVEKTVIPKLGAMAGGAKPVAANSENPSASEEKTGEAPTPGMASVGKRDPFRPYTLDARTSPARRRENLSPLERYELGQLKLVGVIWDVKEPNGMVEDSVGLGYRVKVGTPIGLNDGKVKAIQRGGIVVEESYVDLYGAMKKREVKMTLSVENAE